MTLDRKAEAALALHRFGVGPRIGSIAAIAGDPRGALLAELDRAGAGLIADQDLHTSGAVARAAFQYEEAQRAARQAARGARETGAEGGAPSISPPKMHPPDQPIAAPAAGPRRAVPQQIYLDEAKARIHARSAPRSDLSSGWCGSGRIISACRPTREMSGQFAVPSSAKRSARMCSANFPKCCWRPNLIRQC